MAKGKYTISRRFIKAMDKKIKDAKEIIPDWLKELKKERKEYTNNDANN